MLTTEAMIADVQDDKGGDHSMGGMGGGMGGMGMGMEYRSSKHPCLPLVRTGSDSDWVPKHERLRQSAGAFLC